MGDMKLILLKVAILATVFNPASTLAPFSPALDEVGSKTDQVLSWMGSYNGALSEISTGIDKLLESLQTLFSGMPNKGQETQVTTDIPIAPPVPTVPTVTTCPNPTLFISYVGESDATGTYLYDPSGTGSYKLRQTIEMPKGITSLAMDQSGKRLLTLSPGKDVIIYSRKSCEEDFTVLNSGVGSKSYKLSLDSTDKYFVQRDMDDKKVYVWLIKDDGTIEKSDTYVPEESNADPQDPVFNPKKKNLLAVPTLGVNVIQLLLLDDIKGSLTKLSFKASLPDDLGFLDAAFSSDGKYLYAVGLKKMVYVYEIKMDDSTGDVTDFKQVGDSETGRGFKLLATHPKSGYVYISNSSPVSIDAFKMTSGKLELVKENNDVSTFVGALCVTGDGTQLIAIGQPNSIVVFSIGVDGSLKKENTFESRGAGNLWCRK